MAEDADARPSDPGTTGVADSWATEPRYAEAWSGHPSVDPGSDEPRPDGPPVTTRLVDTHCHLDHHETVSVADQIRRARDGGVEVLVNVGTSMASSTRAVQTAIRNEGIWASVGIHPNDAMEATPEVLEVLSSLVRHEQVVAVGETGLDYYRDHTTPEVQHHALVEHIRLAKEHDKTLIIHCREAWEDLLRTLKEEGPPERVVLHCFSGDVQVTRRCADAGYYMSFAGNVTFSNAGNLREAALEVPDHLLLTETDSPFLSPDPHRGKPNEPARVALVAQTLARVRGRDLEDLTAAVLDNARRAFALPPPA